MSSERWERLNVVFHEAAALDPERRAAYLDAACGGDGELRGQAQRLITAHERAGDFIDAPAILTTGMRPGTAEEAVAPGHRFGPYRIRAEIARGGMGAVFLAERADGQYERQVAIKVIRRGMDIDPMIRRFRAERQILASLEHPNIARLLDGGTTADDRPFFVMEYIDGEPIDRYARSRSLSIAERLRLVLPICDAVAYAHRLGVIHRDIKPANILVTREGVPKLLDFGIAKAVSPDAPGATAAVTGLRLLTPEYASPEQIEGHAATTASDVYSLGVVLYELVTGMSPYQPRGRDPLAIVDAVRTTSPQRPSRATAQRPGRELRGDVDTIVLAALRKEPDRRYPSVDALAADVRRHLDGLPISARRDSRGYRAGKFLKRNRAAVLASGFAVLATSLLAGGFVALRTAGSEPSVLGSDAAAREPVVVSQFAERLGDPLLAAAITEAFRIDLTQSPYVRVLAPSQVRATLERMHHEGTGIADDSVAREVAIREGARAFVSGSVGRLGGAYTVTVQLVSAESGEELTALRETAADSTELVAAVGRASRALRRRLGESLRDLRAMPVLEKTTTASLPALRSYTEGYRAFVNGDRTRAIALYEQAVALDTAFATAYSAIANAYAAMVEPGRAHVARMRALDHRDRLPFREQGMMAASFAFGRNDYETAIRENERLLERYPGDVAVLNNLAFVYRDTRRFAEAEQLWKRAIAIDSTITVLYYGLHNALLPQGRVDEGRRVLDTVRRRTPDDALLPTVTVQQAAAEQDWDEAERLALLNRARLLGDSIQLVDAWQQLAGIAMTRGRLEEAERLWRTQIALSEQTGSHARRWFGVLELAYLQLRFHERPDRARAIVDSALTLHPLETIPPADRPYDPLARFYAELGDTGRARDLYDAAVANDRALDLLPTAERAWTRGVIAFAEGRVAEAESSLREAADRHWCPICPLPDLARVYEAGGRPEAALDTYARYVGTPWLWRYESDAVELGRTMLRIAELHELRRESDDAARAYADLLQLWQHADGPAARTVALVRERLAGVARPR